MSGFFYNLGRRAAPAVLRTRWIYHSLTGDESAKIKAEYSMGCYLTYLHTREGNLERNPRTVAWLNRHAHRLSRALVNRERTFQVRCVLGDEANAFALPGGFLFVSRPLLELCGFDDDEIAFVLAHEMGHVVKSHAFNRIVASEIVQVFSRGGPVKRTLKPLLTRVIRQLLTQGYSRAQEFAADTFAVRLIKAAGYDPEASIRLFERLRMSVGDTAAGYFSSHPPFSLRIERIRERLEKSE